MTPTIPNWLDNVELEIRFLKAVSADYSVYIIYIKHLYMIKLQMKYL